uniref:Uncharacterized protein n=1 Tax=Caenorhabditis japonica TaxID=281687 RepID=A0A8R1ES95_CAEJA
MQTAETCVSFQLVTSHLLPPVRLVSVFRGTNDEKEKSKTANCCAEIMNYANMGQMGDISHLVCLLSGTCI